ncbi:DUF2631 domain-containing protein [Pseudonocardia sp. N23]|uniref:DUF2631 domain-containing protein n=1 Tax=Pseudonocardia sp. N23 TaxID=1987376 RepID=UPI000C0265BE|nr:DUF2631 domain-containing protein [Pseudonocardia sp. N23]GAY07893.1 hypothetical protein TOK_5311 [Pseudonocardia sp. N23]
MAGSELAKRPGAEVEVDPLDEPSAEWGWHGSFPNGTLIAAIATAIILPILLIGHHASWTEIVWMVVPALFVLGGVIGGLIKRRNAWRR